MGHIAQRGQYVNNTLFTLNRSAQFFLSIFPCKSVPDLLRLKLRPVMRYRLSRSSFLKSRKQFRKHHIERDSPRIYRRKNRQAFPRKDRNSPDTSCRVRRSAEPVPLSEIISEVIETLARELEPSSHLEQSSKTGSQVHRGRR